MKSGLVRFLKVAAPLVAIPLAEMALNKLTELLREQKDEPKDDEKEPERNVDVQLSVPESMMRRLESISERTKGRPIDEILTDALQRYDLQLADQEAGWTLNRYRAGSSQSDQIEPIKILPNYS